jgi:hypothetical protein
VLIVNLSKGRIGDDASMLLGSLLVTSLQLAAMSRSDIPESLRREFFVYVDEFLNREEFESEPQARAEGALWKEEYNTERPHSSLSYKTPAEFAATCARYVPIEENHSDLLSTEQPSQ